MSSIESLMLNLLTMLFLIYAFYFSSYFGGGFLGMVSVTRDEEN